MGLESTCWPDQHVFPRSGTHNRSFQSSWLKKFRGLAYSVKEDAAYCVTFPGNKTH
ncbi:hypothetical protein DPMN_041826 [Dreissena polymorpha]|uniref:Uncharacterized protein n=1 Tax=Dreissena polymorpha TaxID=45954 RepID=A0A9D4CZQ7_DREPO|nr:hypothetical protein DPMN_041826 [Dreissena polymorpha]